MNMTKAANIILKKKMTKKQYREAMKKRRGLVSEKNLGTRTMRSARDYDRKKSKREVQNAFQESGAL